MKPLPMRSCVLCLTNLYDNGPIKYGILLHSELVFCLPCIQKWHFTCKHNVTALQCTLSGGQKTSMYIMAASQWPKTHRQKVRMIQRWWALPSAKREKLMDIVMEPPTEPPLASVTCGNCGSRVSVEAYTARMRDNEQLLQDFDINLL